MRGFKPHSARAKPVQHLADGGVVDWLKAKVGIKPDSPELAAYKAEAERERQAQKAAKSIEAAPPAAGQSKAVTDYAGMSAMQRREKAAGLADGGLIRGPGTGTSDSIPDEMAPGTFIMPADSTQALGMDEAGEEDGKVPVRVSNGEFELPPEKVQAIGQAVLSAVKDVTHSPVGAQGGEEDGEAAMQAPMQARGFAPQDEQFFSKGGTVRAMPMRGQRSAPHMRQPAAYADGGVVTDQERKRKGATGVDAIPTGGPKAPAYDGSTSGTEVGRNVNNGLNALGGMGVVATVPLRTAQGFSAVAPEGAALTNAASKLLAGPAQPARAATDFIAGNGPAAVVQNIPRLGFSATPALATPPGVNAALQAGGRANLAASQTRATAGAAAGLGALDQQNNAAPEQPAQAAPAPESDYARQMRLLGNALGDGAKFIGKTIVSAPGYGLSKLMNSDQVPEQVAAAPAAPAPTQPPSATTPPAQPAASASVPQPVVQAAPATTGNVTRVGDSYSGTNVAGDITVNGKAPGGGAVSPQNMAAADALAARGFSPGAVAPAPNQVIAPTVLNSTNDWAARNNLRNLQVSASSITNSGAARDAAVSEFKSALATDQALQQARPGMEQAAMRANAELQREGIQQAGATTRTGIQEQGANSREAGRTAVAQGELGIRQTAAGFQSRAAARVEGLQAKYEAETDPTKRADIARQLREIQGKDQPARFKVAAGGQQIDANGVAYRVPDRVFNEQTGVFSDGAGAAPASAADRPVGTTSTLNGKTAVWDGSKWVPR